VKPEVSILAVCIVVGIVVVFALRGAGAEGVSAAPVFAEEPDYSQYPVGMAGFTGFDLQQVAHWTLKPAMRARIGQRNLYKTAVALLPNGEVLATACYRDEEDTFRIKVYRSGDEGRTWEEVQTEGATVLGKEPALTCLADGTLLLVSQIMGEGVGLYRSIDGGTTWTEPQCELSTYNRNILPQADGSLLLFDVRSRLRSTDGGQTWGQREEFSVEDAPDFHFGETAIVQLEEDHFLATQRLYGEEYEALTGDLIADLPECKGMPNRHECTDHMVLLESEDGGLHWSKPRSFLEYGEVHAYLLPLADGRLLATWSNYHLPFGSLAVLSEDNGQTWDTDHPIQLSISLTGYTGWANSIQLPNGDILTAYAITAYLEAEDHKAMEPGRGDTAAEVVRWRLPGAGEELPPIEPNSEAVFAEEPDYGQYPAGLSGYTGINLQQVAYWTWQPAMRARVGHKGYYKGALVRLPTGDLLGSPAYDRKSKTHIYRSTDEGMSWELVETQGDEFAGGGESRFICLADGTVLLSGSGGVYQSTDNGVTWSRAECDRGTGGYANNIIQQPDGSLLVFGSRGDFYPLSQENPPASTAWRLRSTDSGQTWDERDEVAAWDDPQPMFGEVCVLPLSETHFLATTRVSGDFIIDEQRPPRGLPTPSGDESGDFMVLMESQDAGLHWSEPRRLLNYSEVHAHLLKLADGRILCAYASYHLPFGVFAILSEDNGQTWDYDHPIQLTNSMSMYTGWPTSLQMPDGTILTSYAIQAYMEKNEAGEIEQGSGNSAFEVVRWALPPPE